MPEKAYLIPETLPDGLRCFMIAIPDDDLFLWQFMGAYRFFGTWVAWERDAAKRGTAVAELWRQAIEWTEGHMCDLPDYTEIFGAWPFEGMAVSLAEISAKLDGLQSSQSQSQTITLYNQCCGQVDGLPAPPAWVDDGNAGTGGLPTDPPDETWSTPEEYAAYKCRAANKLVDDFVLTLMGLTSFSGIIGTIGAVYAAALLNTSALSGMIVGLMALGLTASGAVTLLLGVFIAMVLAGESVILFIGDVASGLNKAELVCLLMDSSDTGQAKAAFTAATAVALADVDAGDHAGLLAQFFARLLTVIVPESTMQILFTYDESIDIYEPQEDCACLPPPVWTVHMSTGFCADSSVDEAANTKVSYAGDVILSKSQNNTSYVFYIDRDTALIPAGATFNVGITVDDGFTDWYFRQYQGGSLRKATDIQAGTPIDITVPATGTDRVVLYRRDQLYTAQCPRVFSMVVSITCDAVQWTQ